VITLVIQEPSFSLVFAGLGLGLSVVFHRMTEIDAGQHDANGDLLGETQRGLKGKGLHMWAALVSAVVPGSGQFILGKRRLGILMLGAFGALTLATYFFRLPATYKGYLASLFILLALGLYSVCDALQGSSKITSARPSRWWLWAFLPIGFLLIAVDYVLLFRAAGFRDFSIPSTSMQPTLVPGDRFIVDTRYYSNHDPTYGDIVVISKGKVFLVKRVIAVGGDRIQGLYGPIFLNATRLSEPYIKNSQEGSIYAQTNTFGPIFVPPGQYFVMGDNRDESYDSRIREFGPVSREMIAGKPLYIYYSAANRIGSLIH